jgi:hypothetical protein
MPSLNDRINRFVAGRSPETKIPDVYSPVHAYPECKYIDEGTDVKGKIVKIWRFFGKWVRY